MHLGFFQYHRPGRSSYQSTIVQTTNLKIKLVDNKSITLSLAHVNNTLLPSVCMLAANSCSVPEGTCSKKLRVHQC
jgi:hypothetical protein